MSFEPQLPVPYTSFFCGTLIVTLSASVMFAAFPSPVEFVQKALLPKVVVPKLV